MFIKNKILFSTIASIFIHGGMLTIFMQDSPDELVNTKSQPLPITLVNVDQHTEKELEVGSLIEKSEIVKPKKKNASKKVIKYKTKISAAIESKVQNEVIDSRVSEIRANYETLVASWLARHKRYPLVARRRGNEGEGVVKLTLLPNGNVSDIQVLQETGIEVLDKEILAMIKRANPFPKFPKNYNKSRLTIMVPIRFELR